MQKKVLSVLVCLVLLASALAGCSGGGQASSAAPAAGSASQAEGTPAASGEEVIIEFAQWWEPELPAGAFRALMDKFEAQNPGVKVELISAPFAATQEQMVASIATGTLADVVGLGGAFVRDFAKQGAITDLTALMAQEGYDDSALASQWQLDGATYMVPVVTFIYPMFVNNDLLAQAGITELPTTRSEFVEAARAISALDPNISGWVMPMALDAPNGIQNDLMSWLWSSGDSMMQDGKPNLAGNQELAEVVSFVKDMYDEGLMSPGAFALKEQDKVEEFRNGRVGMMIGSMSFITAIREGNPDLDFSLIPIPVKDGYTGEHGVHFAPWGIGVAETSEHKAEAWALIEFLMSEESNAELATLANAFPGNVNATPDFVKTDEKFGDAFEIYQNNFLRNEFFGLPVATELMRRFDEQMQLMLEGDQDIEQMLQNAQDAWDPEFA